ncbi:hypothetical protein [Eupransor demetentiae]
MEKEAQQRGIHSIRLNSGMNRTAAHHFYEKNGYQEIKEQKKFSKKLM